MNGIVHIILVWSDITTHRLFNFRVQDFQVVYLELCLIMAALRRVKCGLKGLHHYFPRKTQSNLSVNGLLNNILCHLISTSHWRTLTVINLLFLFFRKQVSEPTPMQPSCKGNRAEVGELADHFSCSAVVTHNNMIWNGKLFRLVNRWLYICNNCVVAFHKIHQKKNVIW